MKQPRVQCTYKDSRTNTRCTSRICKSEESLCVKHEIQQIIPTTALDRVLKQHGKHCTYWIFSGDRHCSCGRDAAITELDRMRSMLRALIGISKPNISKGYYGKV